MARTPLYEWEGYEYEHNPKSGDWYWALGIIAVAAAIASLLFGNYLLTVLIVVAAAAIALHAAKPPPLHSFRLNHDGLYIGDEFHPFKHMTSFSVLEDVEGELPPLLSVKTSHWLSPHLEIPLEHVDVDGVYECFLHNVEEGEHTPTLVHMIGSWLGF